MIKVTIGSNMDRNSVIVPSTDTLRKTLEDNGVNYERGTLHLDGASLKPGDIDKTYDELGILEKAYLISVVKADGGK